MLRVATRLSRGDHPPNGWAIVAALGITETVSYGVLAYAFAVLLVPMQDEAGWSVAAITGAYSLALLVSGLVGLRVGRLLDHRSPRLPMTGGSVLAALLVLAWSRASTLLELYLVFAGLGVAMALVLYEPAFVVVAKWFRVRRHAALTTLTVIAAFASFVFSPLTELLASAYGWRDAVALLGLILAAVTIPLHALVLRPHPRNETPAQVSPVATRSPIAPTRQSVARSVSFWLLVAAFALSAFAGVAIAVHLVPLLIGGGTGAAYAAFALGLMGIAQIPGRLVFALAARRLGTATMAAAVFALGAVALVLLTVSQSRLAVLVFVVCFGMSNGMATLLRATLVGDLYGQASYGAISGLVGVFALAARAAAPFAAALIALAPGGYDTLLAVLAATMGAAALAAGHGVHQVVSASSPRGANAASGPRHDADGSNGKRGGVTADVQHR